MISQKVRFKSQWVFNKNNLRRGENHKIPNPTFNLLKKRMN